MDDYIGFLILGGVVFTALESYVLAAILFASAVAVAVM